MTDKDIQLWALGMFGKDQKTMEENHRRYRIFYDKALTITTYDRPYPVSDLLNLESSFPVTPLGKDLVPLVGINHPHRTTLLIRENESEREHIFEGLITTYPKPKLIEQYKDFCEENLNSRLLSLNAGEVLTKVKSGFENKPLIDYIIEDPNNPPIIAFMIPFFKTVKTEIDQRNIFIKGLVDRLSVCGYNLSQATQLESKYVIQPFDDEQIEVILVSFEALFFDVPVELSDTLYHVSPSRYFGKIRKYGLIPRSKSDRFKYPERVYLFNKATVSELENYGIRKINMLNTKDPIPGKPDNSFVIFSIKKEKLENYQPYKEKKTIFYYDPCYKIELGGIGETKAIFTYNNIPRELLDDVCWYYTIDEKTGHPTRKGLARLE